MTIERIQEKDVEDLDKLISREFHYKKLSQEKIAERMKNPEIIIFKKTVGKKLAGFIEIQIRPQKAIINAISIKEGYRKKGFAKELLEFALGFLKEHGAARVILLVKKENEIAKRLYAKYGFEFVGIHGRKIDYSEIEIWEKIIEHNFDETQIGNIS